MKILDASAVFAMPSQPGLAGRILQLGHAPAIPSNVLERELLDEQTREAADRLVREKKITILYANEYRDVKKFMHDNGIGMGESDVMLAYMGLTGAEGQVYCIIDDWDARLVAKGLGIPLGGLARLFRLMVARSIMTSAEARCILWRIKRRRFRITEDLIEWACAG